MMISLIFLDSSRYTQHAAIYKKFESYKYQHKQCTAVCYFYLVQYGMSNFKILINAKSLSRKLSIIHGDGEAQSPLCAARVTTGPPRPAPGPAALPAVSSLNSATPVPATEPASIPSLPRTQPHLCHARHGAGPQLSRGC